jgi:hypothetical protein
VELQQVKQSNQNKQTSKSRQVEQATQAKLAWRFVVGRSATGRKATGLGVAVRETEARKADFQDTDDRTADGLKEAVCEAARRKAAGLESPWLDF